MMCSVVIAMSNRDSSEKLKSLLTGEGYYVIATVESGNELIRIIRSNCPDIVVTGYKFTDMTLMDVYNRVGDLVKFLAIVNEQYRSFIQDESDIFCISTSINRVVLSSSIDMILQSDRRVNRFKKKVEVLENKIEERKTIEKAKGKLIKDMLLSEEEAFRYIQKRAMDERTSALKVAQELLDN